MPTEEEIRKNTTLLWKLIEETLEYYNSISCQCAFPRFRQYVSINCVDYQGSFYMSETEGFIHHAVKYFNIQEISTVNNECTSRLWQCKKCASTFLYGWADFSIHVSRSYLKLNEHKAEDIGSESLSPIRFFVGLFGHKYPGKDLFRHVTFDQLKNYLRSTR